MSTSFPAHYQMEKGFHKVAEELVVVKDPKGAANVLQMQERRPIDVIKAEH